MAKAAVSNVTSKAVTLIMGPKEAQSVRNLLARVKKGSAGPQAKNLNNVRKAMETAGFHKSRESQLKGVITAAVAR
jgi:hypothetical protein